MVISKKRARLAAGKSRCYVCGKPYSRGLIIDGKYYILCINCLEYIESKGDLTRSKIEKARREIELEEEIGDIGDEEWDEIMAEGGLVGPGSRKLKPPKKRRRNEYKNINEDLWIEVINELLEDVVICPVCEGYGKKGGRKCKECDGYGEVFAGKVDIEALRQAVGHE